MGPELREICTELGRAREKEKQQEERFADAERTYQDKIGELQKVLDEQKTRLRKYDELQKKWTQAARMDEQKMRELHGRIEELEGQLTSALQ